MATVITNRATITYSYGLTTAQASSNIASTVLNEPLTLTKSVLESSYTAGATLTYIISITNDGASLTGLTVTDNLGTYAISPTLSGAALFFRGPARYYVNGVYVSTIVPEPLINAVGFTLPALNTGDHAMLIYTADVNQDAPLIVGSAITNTVTVSSPQLAESITASTTIPVASYADVRITKTMSPNPVMDGSQLTYTFTIYNYGNVAAENAVFTDSFNPAPTNVSVSVNGVQLAAGSYSYVGGTLTIPAVGSSFALDLPAATITQDVTTGEVTVSPSQLTVVVNGTI